MASLLISVMDSKEVTADEVVSTIEPGSVVLLGESHAGVLDKNSDQVNQVTFIKKLIEKYDNVHVGMEFIDYTVQKFLDQYLKGELTDEEFQKAIGWTAPFLEYQQQILLPTSVLGWTHGLNAPRTLTQAIVKKGLDNLTSQQKALVPPNFQVGREIYRQRFYEAMGTSHGETPLYQRMFVAQSMWDDVMAWQTVQKFKTNPQQIMVIIVGNFHVRYGGGLADRLKARGLSNITSIVQIESEGLSEDETQAVLKPHSEYGIIADYLW